MGRRKLYDLVVVMVRDTEGMFFAHQRKKVSQQHPGFYGIGVDSPLLPKEKPQRVAERTLRNCIGIRAKPTPLFSFVYRESRKPFELHVFELVTDEAPTVGYPEWLWGGWITRSALDGLLRGSKFYPDAEVLVERYLKEYADRSGEA